MPWSPDPDDTYETGPGWATTWTPPTTQLPGWVSAPQPAVVDAPAEVAVVATAHVELAADALADVEVVATAVAAAITEAPATLPTEGTVMPANAVVDAPAEFTIEAEGLTSTSAANGLPYTLPFVLGPIAPVLEVFTVANAVVAVDATAVVELAVAAPADFTVLAAAYAASDPEGALPYTLPFVLGGDPAADVIPLELPFLLV